MHRRYIPALVVAVALVVPGLLRLAGPGMSLVAHAAPLFQAPANDDFANATVISSLPYGNTQDTTSATTEANDPVLPCIPNWWWTNGGQGWHSVWYAYTATADGALHVDTAGSDYDTVLGVWTGPWGALNNVACDDDSGAGTLSSLDVAVVAGTTYYIEVAGYFNSSAGTLVLSADLLAPPANDDFDHAFVIADTPYTYSQDTSRATTAGDDPTFQSCGTGSGQAHAHSVWYRFTPDTDGVLYLDTSGSDYDTVLAVWTGSRGALTPVACHDDVDWPADPTSIVETSVTAGTTYHVEIVAYGSGAGGSLVFHANLGVNKPLFLHHLTSPVTLVDGSTTTETMDRREVWGGEATVTFDNSPTHYAYLSPGLAGDLVLQGTIDIYLYLEADNDQDSDVTVGIADLSPGGSLTTIGTDTVQVPRRNDGWYTFTLADVDYVVAQGRALVVGMRTRRGNQDVTLHYDSALYNSRVELSAATYVDVEQVSTRSACHPSGSTVLSAGQAMTLTARVSDPFGSYDIAGAAAGITDPGGQPALSGAAMAPQLAGTGAITYALTYSIPLAAGAGTYTAVVTGTESNGVQALGTTTFTVQSPATLTAGLAAGPPEVDVGQTMHVTMTVTNGGQAAALGVAPSPLTVGGGGAAALAAGPVPTSADVAGGDAVAFTWTYTATAPGPVNWSGNATGTDANSCASVSSAGTTSNDVLVAAGLAGVAVIESGGSTDVTEDGATDTYQVVLIGPPTAAVQVTISPDAQTTVLPTLLTFDGTNWDVPQSVTVSAVDDDVVEGLHTSTLAHSAASADPNYDGIAIDDVVANVTDNDTAAVVVTESGGSTTVAEGGAGDSYELVLTSQPTATVTISVVPDAQTSALPGVVTFDGTNWDTPQTVTVSAVDDDVAEGSHSGAIVHSAASADPNYNGLAIDGVVAQITDNDAAGIVVTESGGSTSVAEGGAGDSYELVLTSQPTATVTIFVLPDSQVSAVPAVVAFDGTNWDTPQAVIVSAVDDDVVEGPHSGAIAHSAASADPNYDGIAVSGVTVHITDNDTAQVTIGKSVSPSTPGQFGQFVTYTIAISNAGPSSVQVVQITDTLPAGFVYSTTVGATGIDVPDTVVVNGQQITWSFSPGQDRKIGADETATLTFVAQSGASGGCNSAGVTIQGQIGVVAAPDLACLWPEYYVTSRSGSHTIRVHVRLVAGQPVILSWEFLP